MSKYDEFIAGGDWDGWDKEEHISDPAKTKTYFGKIRLFLNITVKRFQKGQHFTLPGVLNFPYDEATQSSGPPTGPQEFRGMTIGKSNEYIHFIVTEMLDQNGQIYQRKWRYNSWYEKDDTTGENRPNGWNDFQKAEFFKLPKADRIKLGNTGKLALNKPDDPNAWLYARFDLAPTNYKHQFDPKTYISNLVIFADETEMKKAEQEWRSQFNSEQPKDYSHYPQMWQSKPEALAKFAKKQSEAGKSYKEVAVACKLLDDDGNPVDNANGGEVNVVALLAELLDLPEELVTL